MSALAEALVAAQAELPCALGKDADGQIGTRSYDHGEPDTREVSELAMMPTQGAVSPAERLIYRG